MTGLRLAGALLLLAVHPAVPAAPAQERAPANGGRPVIVASKPFGESYLLAEILAQLLEARGIPVTRRPGLGATEIAFRALRSGDIDVYPEYTGTGLLVILGQPPSPDAADVYRRVSVEFRRRYGMRWLAPLGFENTYAIAVRRATADSLHLATLDELARVSPRLTAGLTADFIGRPDGLPGLTSAYGLRFGTVHALSPALKYQALAQGAVDVIDGYSTDGLISRYDLVVLRDDRHFFPPYQAAALVGAGLQRSRPAAVLALSELSGQLDVSMMRELNRRVEVNHEPVATVASDALRRLALTGGVSGVPPRARRGGSILRYLVERRRTILQLTLRHLLLVGLSLGAGMLIGVPLGLVLERAGRGAEPVVRTIGLVQTLPGMALLAFMIPLLGVGVVPALVALSIYSVYPILRNTYTGVRDADPAAVAGATGSGMSPGQVLRYVRLPLAVPVIMAGIRTAAVIGVGTATLAAFIGAGGLGDPIVAGLALSDVPMILSGAIPAALLALAVDLLLAEAERLVRPRGVGARGA